MLLALHENENFVKICRNNNIEIEKTISVKDENIFYAQNLSIQIHQMKLVLTEVKKIELLYGKFLLLITKEMGLFYVTIDEENKEFKSNEIIKSYTECSVKHKYFVCRVEGDEFDLIEIEFQ